MLAIVLGVGAVVALIGFVAQEMNKQGLTAGALLGIALGLLLLLFEWIASWPGYVWLGLLVVFILFRIESRLAYLASRLSVLDRRTVKIGRAVNTLRGRRAATTMTELLVAFDAFMQEHRRCGELDGGVDGGRVWMACECGTYMAHRVDGPVGKRGEPHGLAPYPGL